MERMSGDDQSFAELMDLCGNHFAKRPRMEEEDKPSDRRPARKGQRKPSRSSDSDLGEDGSLIPMLAKLTEHQGGVPPPSRQRGLDVRREVQPCRRGEYLQIREQGNINTLPDPRWHKVFCQVTPE